MTQGNLSLKGELGIQKITPPGPPLAWRIKNFPNWWRGYWRLQLQKAVARITSLPFYFGTLELTLIKADGRRINFGPVSYRVVTSAFVNAAAANMVNNATSPVIDSYDYHDCGTGTTAEASADTTLVTAFGGSRSSGTASNPSSNVYRSVGTITFSGTFAVTEHGLFSASTSGTLLDRSVFSAVNVVSGDSIQFTYSLTLTAGG